MASPYEIFTRVTLENKASAVLATLAKDVLNVEGGVNKLAKAFEQAGIAAKVMAAGLMGAAGIGIIATLYKTAQAAGELSHQLAQIREQGVGLQQMGGIKSAIMGVHGQVPGIASDQAAKIFGQVRSLVGDEDAKKLLVPLSKFAQLFGNVSGRPEGGVENLRSLVRAADIIGRLTDPKTHQVDLERFQNFLNLASKATIATHGVVGPQTWLALAQQGGPAMSRMSDQGLMTMAMLSQEMGGFRSGTALSSLFSQFQGGIMTKWRAMKFTELGLLDKNAIQDITPGGHIVWRKGLEPGTSPFAQAMAEDPIKAVEMLRGAMETHGYKGIDKQVPLLFELLQRQTSIREIHALLRNTEQMKSERGRMFGAMGLGEALDYMNKHDLTQAMTNFGKAFHDMMIKIGDVLTDKTISILRQLSAVFDAIGKYAQANPEIIKALATSLGVLGVTLTGAAGVALMSAIGPAGWLIGGLTAFAMLELWHKGEDIKNAIKYLDELAGAISGKLETALKTAADAFNKFADFLTALGKKVWDYISTLGGLLQKTGFGGGGGDWTAGAGMQNISLGGGSKAHDLGIVAKAFEGSPYKNAALLTASTEGAGNYFGDYSHGRPTSFGPFQLHRGGGLGDQYPGNLGDTSDASKFAQAVWVRKWVEKHGGFPSSIWHGLRHVHPNHGRIGTVRPHSGGGSQGSGEVEASVFIDGKSVASHVVKHVMASLQHATQAPHFDGRGMYSGPDAQLNTA